MDILLDNKVLSGSIEAISSKSYAQRAIFCSILARGKSRIKLDTISEDIEAAIDCARAIGCKVSYEDKILLIDSSGKLKDEALIDIKESGTSLRLILSVLGVLNIKSQIIRSGSLVKRTNEILFDLLRSSGVEIKEKDSDIYMQGTFKSGSYKLRADVSSQFISSAMLGLAYYKDKSFIELTSELESKPYVNMTIDVMKNFSASVEEKENGYLVQGPYTAADYEVEKDWSNALFFIASGAEVMGLNLKSKQADRRAMDFIKDLGYENISEHGVKIEKLRPAKKIRILDAKDMPDSVPILSVLAAKEEGYTKVINIERLRYKESNRIKTTLELLKKLGVNPIEKDNSFEFSSIDKFNSARIKTYNDHRIAMSAVIASSFCKSKLRVDNVECIDKSYINFLDDFKNLGGVYSVL
jgi:3-phosphoshikimate 1-carboxyvinyltransferase